MIRENVLLAVGLNPGHEHIDLLNDAAAVVDADLIANCVRLREEQVDPGCPRGEQLLERDPPEENQRERVRCQENEQRAGRDPDLAQRDQRRDVENAVFYKLRQQARLGELDRLEPFLDRDGGFIAADQSDDDRDNGDEQPREIAGQLGPEHAQLQQAGDLERENDHSDVDEHGRQRRDNTNRRGADASGPPLERCALDDLWYAVTDQPVGDSALDRVSEHSPEQQQRDRDRERDILGDGDVDAERHLVRLRVKLEYLSPPLECPDQTVALGQNDRDRVCIAGDRAGGHMPCA